jgi:hypothetical protein
MAVCGARPVAAWGDKAHLAVTRLAVETLSGACADTFRPHTEALARKSFEPDSVLRRRAGREEEIRHFINLDSYMRPPFAAFPRDYREAVRRHGKREVDDRGVVPWVILRFTRELAQALRGRDEATAVRKAAYLSHYIADAFQPLHLTADYDGKQSGHAGVHSRYENNYVDASIKDLAKAVRAELSAAAPAADLRSEVFEAMFRSYAGVEVIFRADGEAQAAAAHDARAHRRFMESATGDLTRRQLAGAVRMIGSAWMKACDGGTPSY